MQITPKTRLICLIVALVFALGALIGTGTYLIINHINNSKALSTINYVSLGNIFESDGKTLNSDVCKDILDRLGSRTGPIGGGSTGRYIAFTMAGCEWQVVYRDTSENKDIITVWMCHPYTTSTYGGSSSYYGNYVNSSIRTIVNNYYNTRLVSYPGLADIVLTPDDVSSTYKTAQAQQYTEERYTSTGGALDGSEHFWLPSLYEAFSFWGLRNADRGFSTSYYESGSSNYCWLRSGWTSWGNAYTYAMRVYLAGSASADIVNLSHGVRPAAHLSLSALEAAIPSYTITVRSNNISYGTVDTSGGTYYEGTSVTLTATPASGYRFVRWERNGSQVSTSASYTFTVSGSYTYTAIFERATATISTAVSPAGTGTATGGGTYNINSQATLSATPASGYKFVGWQLNGAIVSTSASYTFTVSSSTSGTYTAIFTPATYTVIMETSGYPSLVGGLAGGFENTGWSGTYGTEHVRSGSYSLKITGNTSTPEVTVPTTNTVPLVYTSGEQTIDKRNHVFYFQYWGYQETRAGASTQIYWPIEEPSMGSIALGPAGQWNMYSFYGTRSNNSATTSSVRIDFDNANQAGTIWFDDFLMLDLTEIFGAGREPSKEWCDMHIISGTNTQTIQYDTSTTLETRPGGDSTIYTFAGWSTTPKTTNTTNQTVQYSNGGTVSNITNAGGSITLYGIWEYRPFARASATLGGEVRISGNDLGTGTSSTTVSYEAIPYTGYYLIGWYVGDMLYTENSTTYTGTTLTLPREQAEGVVVVPVFSTNTTGTPSLSFDLDNNTAITASIGGEARIIGDTYSTTDTVTLIAAVQMQGYRFVGWYIDGIQVSTDETTILSRATVLGKIVQARFAPIDNTNMNDDTDNTQTDDFVFF